MTPADERAEPAAAAAPTAAGPGALGDRLRLAAELAVSFLVCVAVAAVASIRPAQDADDRLTTASIGESAVWASEEMPGSLPRLAAVVRSRQAAATTAVSGDLSLVTAAVQLRRRLADMPGLGLRSDQILVTPRAEGLAIDVLEAADRPLFGDHGREAGTDLRQVAEALVPMLNALPHRIAIAAHVPLATAGGTDAVDPWAASIAHAEAMRRLLVANGLPVDRIASVVGKAATEPMFREAPALAANGRVTVILLAEAPPAPPGTVPY